VVEQPIQMVSREEIIRAMKDVKSERHLGSLKYVWK